MRVTRDPVAHVYAQALLELGMDKGIEESLVSDLLGLEALVQGEPEFRVFLESPGIEKDEKRRILETALEGKVDRLVLNLLLLLVDNNREAHIVEIAETAADLYREHVHQILVYVGTAVDVDEGDLDDLKKAVETRYQRTCVFQIEVDPSLLGGIVVRIGDIQVDASVKSRLVALRKRLERAEITKEAAYEAQT